MRRVLPRVRRLLRRISGVAWLLRVASRVLRSGTAGSWIAWSYLEATRGLLRWVTLRWILPRVRSLRVLLRWVHGRLLGISSGRIACWWVTWRRVAGRRIASRWVLRLRVGWLSNHYWLRHHNWNCSWQGASSRLVVRNILGL